MLFRLCNTPATFERLKAVPTQNKQIYLDDVLIHGPDFNTALQALWLAFPRIYQVGLKLNPEKCRLMQGVSTLEDKATAVWDWAVSKNVSEHALLPG